MDVSICPESREERTELRRDIETYTAQSPKEVSVLPLICNENLPSWRDNLHLEHTIHRKAQRRRQDTMSSTSDITSHTDTLCSSTNDHRVVLIRQRVEIVHLCPAAGRDGVSGDDGVAITVITTVAGLAR